MAETFRFAHIADAHLGAWPRDAALREAHRTCVLDALRRVREERCDFLLLAGDTFHTPTPPPSEAAPLAAALRELFNAGIRVYAIYGSHDYIRGEVGWLDVLSEGGLFTRVAIGLPAPSSGSPRFPFVRDEPTGAVLAGISGRPHSLDRETFRELDSQAFREAPGYHIFLFHCAVEDYLPPTLHEHVPALPRGELPPGCDYYAGGHIHATYEGEGPGGGLLINPGALFGTSLTDLENLQKGVTFGGFVIVDVEDGRIVRRRWVRTAPSPQSILLADIDVTGLSVSEARDRLRERVGSAVTPGTILLPRLHGRLAAGHLQQLDLESLGGEWTRAGARSVRFDTTDLDDPVDPNAGSPVSGVFDEAEEMAFLAQLTDTDRPLPGFRREEKSQVAVELFRELGNPQEDGQSREDYRRRMTQRGFRLLRLLPSDEGSYSGETSAEPPQTSPAGRK
jgi:exonuclease SbcD